jgi:hypothetical protein
VAAIRAGQAAAAAAAPEPADAAHAGSAGSSRSRRDSNTLGHGAILLRGTLALPNATTTAGTGTPASTFLHIGGWGRGEVWVNWHSLGRYWAGQGPAMTLYCPGSFLLPGRANEVVVLELEARLPPPAAGGTTGGADKSSGLPTMASVAQPDFSGPPGGVEPLWM